MTKKRKKINRNRQNFVAIPFSNASALGALTDETIIKSSLTPAFGEDIWIISVDINFIIRDGTSGETPLFVGLAHGDYTVAEILEAVNAEVTDPDDKIAQEHAKRKVRKIGAVYSMGTAPQRFNDGKIFRQKVQFSVGDGHTIDFWIKNQSGATLTTGGVLEMDGVIYGRWQR